MRIDQTVDIPAPAERVWEFLMDVPAVSACVPGVESFEALGDDTYRGTLRVSVGPIGAKLGGKVTVTERNAELMRSGLRVSAADSRIGSKVTAETTMTLVPYGDGVTRLQIAADVSILGKLGSFGQSVIRRKADQLILEFAANVTRSLAR
jgi:uncharacterized protein